MVLKGNFKIDSQFYVRKSNNFNFDIKLDVLLKQKKKDTYHMIIVYWLLEDTMQPQLTTQKTKPWHC